MTAQKKSLLVGVTRQKSKGDFLSRPISCMQNFIKIRQAVLKIIDGQANGHAKWLPKMKMPLGGASVDGNRRKSIGGLLS